MTTRIKDYSWLEQINEDNQGRKQWRYTESRAWGYETITFWSMPGEWPMINDTVEGQLLVKANKDQVG